MKVDLKTSAFHAQIDSFGAELKSLKSSSSGCEHIWNGDPLWWNGSAPVLFPIIGGLKNGSYNYKDISYKLPSHGFARNSDFDIVETTSETAVLELKSNDTTRAMYPFEFRLRVVFTMDYSGLTVRYQVINGGTGPMYFSIGSHPAFTLNFGDHYLEHYYLHFSASEHAERHFFRDGMLLEQSEPVFDNSRQLFITRQMFDKGPLIFKEYQSDEISIRCSRSKHSVTLLTECSPYLAIWSKPGGAPFICIEPWHGLPDPVDSNGDITSKPGIIEMPEGKTFETGYSILIK